MKKRTPIHAGSMGYETAICGVKYPAYSAAITMAHWLATCKNCRRMIKARERREKNGTAI